MAESEGELKSLLSSGKEQSEKADLKLNIQKKKINKDHGSKFHHFTTNRRGKKWKQ